MNKIEVLDCVVSKDEEPLKNFLDSLLYLDEFSFFYNLIKFFDFKYEILPSFIYSENRETPEQVMKEFRVRLLEDIDNTEEIVNTINSYIKSERFNYECTYDNDLLIIKLK